MITQKALDKVLKYFANYENKWYCFCGAQPGCEAGEHITEPHQYGVTYVQNDGELDMEVIALAFGDGLGQFYDEPGYLLGDWYGSVIQAHNLVVIDRKEGTWQSGHDFAQANGMPVLPSVALISTCMVPVANIEEPHWNALGELTRAYEGTDCAVVGNLILGMMMRVDLIRDGETVGCWFVDDEGQHWDFTSQDQEGRLMAALRYTAHAYSSGRLDLGVARAILADMGKEEFDHLVIELVDAGQLQFDPFGVGDTVPVDGIWYRDRWYAYVTI